MAVELTTVVQVSSEATAPWSSLVENLEHAVGVAISDLGMAAVTAYFVRPDADARNIQVGLRFNGMDAGHIEDAATELLEHAFEIASSVNSSDDVRRVRSQLVSA